MRFFTNENKDDDVKDRDGDTTESSDTVALPHQRGNSPWSSTPDTDASGIHRRDDDTPNDEARHDEARHDEARHDDPRDDEPLIEDPTPPDHAVADTSPDAIHSDATHSGTDHVEATGTAAVPDAPAARTLDDDTETVNGKDATLRDDGDFDDPKVADEPDTVVADEPDGTALKDDGGFDDPKAVDPVTDATLTDHDTTVDDTTDHDDTPVVAAPIVAEPAIDARTADDTKAVNDTKPGEVHSPEVTTIFDGDDAKAFQDRWRDVQLRFVDSPKEATAEAAALVDDAVEKLTASLRSQKEGFGGESTEDTEKLRVELRGYRDLFNRIIGL